MKNILNVNKISLKPIFMSLAILFTTGVSFPNSFEKVVGASYSDEQTIDENTENQSLNGILELPKESHGCPLQAVEVRKCRDHFEIFGKYRNNPENNDNLSCFMEVRSVKFKNSNASVNNDLDDIGRLDGNSREQSLWQKCCSCCFKNSNKKND